MLFKTFLKSLILHQTHQVFYFRHPFPFTVTKKKKFLVSRTPGDCSHLPLVGLLTKQLKHPGQWPPCRPQCFLRPPAWVWWLSGIVCAFFYPPSPTNLFCQRAAVPRIPVERDPHPVFVARSLGPQLPKRGVHLFSYLNEVSVRDTKLFNSSVLKTGP